MSQRVNNPVIRYLKSSDVCFRLAEKLNTKLREESEFTTKVTKMSVPQATTILLYDRREDPVTPLLNQWTY